MRVSVLGPISVTDDSGNEPDLSPSLRQLLAVLVAAGKRGMTQDSIAEEVWGEELPASWESAFRNGVTRLRTRLGKEALLATSGRYRLNAELVEVDAWSLIDLVTDHAESSLCGPSFATYLTGAPFIGIEYSPAVRSMSDSIEASRLQLIRARGLNYAKPLHPHELAVLRSYQRSNTLDLELLELGLASWRAWL